MLLCLESIKVKTVISVSYPVNHNYIFHAKCVVGFTLFSNNSCFSYTEDCVYNLVMGMLTNVTTITGKHKGDEPSFTVLIHYNGTLSF